MNDRAENTLLVLPGLALLALAFFVPITQMLILSVSGDDGPTLAHFTRFLGDPYYLGVLWRTVRLSILITVICAAIGFPLAYIMARVGPRLRHAEPVEPDEDLPLAAAEQRLPLLRRRHEIVLV